MRRQLFTLLLLLTWKASALPPTPPSGATAVKPASRDCCAVLELRQYTLHPGQRDVLIDLFEREFVESQEDQGAHLVGQFRDSVRPERFVWLRGFPDMVSREQTLKRFYGGPVWKAHREAANATMQDSSNVLLLRPVTGSRGFPPPGSPRPDKGNHPTPNSVVVVTILHRDAPVDAAFLRFVEQQLVPVLSETGGAPLALLQTEYAPNTFPALPVREGEHVLVAFTVFASREKYLAHVERLANSRRWNDTVRPALLKHLKAAPESLVLEPTARSLLR